MKIYLFNNVIHTFDVFVIDSFLFRDHFHPYTVQFFIFRTSKANTFFRLALKMCITEKKALLNYKFNQYYNADYLSSRIIHTSDVLSSFLSSIGIISNIFQVSIVAFYGFLSSTHQMDTHFRTCLKNGYT